MQYYHKKTNTICFEGGDLENFFKTSIKKGIVEEVARKGYSLAGLLSDKKKTFDIVESIKIINDKEDVEIFAALYSLLQFYPKGTKICFPLENGVDPRKEHIDSLGKLKLSLEENDSTDFAFLTKEGFRAVQLKIYKEEARADKLFNFIREKLLRYGNDLSNMNLLVIMQGKGDIEGDFFQSIHEKLKAITIKGIGHILIAYNEENKFDVMNTVYPILGTTRIPHQSLNDL